MSRTWKDQKGPQVGVCSVGYTCPLRKASRTSMSFSRVLGVISKTLIAVLSPVPSCDGTL